MSDLLRMEQGDSSVQGEVSTRNEVRVTWKRCRNDIKDKGTANFECMHIMGCRSRQVKPKAPEPIHDIQ
jgi:hypothetical protein